MEALPLAKVTNELNKIASASPPDVIIELTAYTLKLMLIAKSVSIAAFNSKIWCSMSPILSRLLKR